MSAPRFAIGSAGSTSNAPGGDLFARRVVRICLALGLLLSAVMVLRSQVGGDQLSLLARGWLLAERGVLIPYGNPLSGGGYEPGPATSVVVGLPLAIWRDHRAPAASIWLLHLGAWLFLDRRLRGVLRPGERAVFALVYWLNPWRLTAASTLWNPNYGFLLGAIHFATAFDQRERPKFWASLAHVAALGIGAQLHPSILLLIVASLILAVTRTVKVHWPGALAGVAASLLALVPWLEAVRARPELIHGEGGYFFRALVLVQPWLKGIVYWFRYPSLWVSSESQRLDFTALAGAADAWLAPSARGLLLAAGIATALAAIAANVQLVRNGWARQLLSRGPAADARELVQRYVAICAAAAIVVFASSPTTPQSWQGFPIFHAAALPLAFWLGPRLEPGAGLAGGARGWFVAWAAASVAIALALAFGAPSYRCGGRNELRLALMADSPMFAELGIQRDCRFPTNVPGGWWPDALPPE